MYGRLTARRRLPKSAGRIMWEFLCECGNLYEGRASHVKAGAVRSCGCLATEVAVKKGTIGQTYTAEYRIWRSMLTRCLNPASTSYWRYGGRGITVFPSWRDDFLAFRDYLGDRPSPRHSIDRIDGRGNYEPGNVRWASPQEQARNRSSTIFIDWGGKRRPFIEVCESKGVKYSTALMKFRAGRALEQIFGAGQPVG